MSSSLIQDDKENGVIPLDEYNAEEGKLLASISWLIAKAYKSNIPDNLVTPCFKDEANALRLKPGTVQSLVSGELYRAALAAISDNTSPVSSDLRHADILRILREFYSVPLYDPNGQPLTEHSLTQTNPFNVNAHLALTDGLMIAYVRNSVTVDRVVNCLKKYTNIKPKEIPNDDEDGLSFWINKICFCVRETFDKMQVGDDDFFVALSMEKIGDFPPLIPEMDDLYEDIYDGICLATVLSFYASDKLNINDVSFNDPIGVDDCLHNLRLIKNFCQRCSWNVFHFAYEDILYMHENLQQSSDDGAGNFLLQPNIGAFVTDLFNLLEPNNQQIQSQTGASVAKQFGKVQPPSIADQRQKTFIRSPKTPTQSDNIDNNKSIFLSTSRINSADSPMGHRQNSKESPLTLNLASFTDGGQVRKSPTTTFGLLSPQRDQVLSGTSLTSPYQRSDSLPANRHPQNLSSPSSNGKGGATTSWSVRMNLDEKRRQIEIQQMKEKSEKAKRINDMNKDVLLTLYGKKPAVSNQPGKPPPSLPTTVSAASKLIRPSAAKVHSNKSAVAVESSNNKSSKEYDDISKSILEIKEQMKRLSVEQEKLQNLVVPSPTNSQQQTFPEPNQAPPFHLHNILPSQPIPPGSARNFSPHGDVVSSSFHLHNENEPPSRLDPSLELSKNLSNWGMTYRVNKTPRKTWDNQQQQQAPASFSSINNENNDLRFPVNTRLTASPIVANGNNVGGFYVNNQQQQQSPSGHNRPLAPTGEMLNSRVVPNSVIPVAVSFDVPAEPGVASSSSSVSSMNANKKEMPPLYIATGARQSPQNATAAEPSPTSPSLQMSPLPGGARFAEDDVTTTLAAQQFDKSKECSPGVGFIVGDDERRKQDEVNRKKEQIMAAALRRKAELDSRKARIDAEAIRRQEELTRKQEEEEQKKKEKELHRLKVFEQYQKNKADQEALEQGGGAPTTPASSGAVLKAGGLRDTKRGHSQPPARQARPMSQVVPAKVPGLSNIGIGSVDNLDLFDGKSQSSDGCGSVAATVEPSLKLFVKPSQKSNRTIVYNAIQYSVLAGSANNDKKGKVLEELAKSDSKHFLILFRDQKCQFRGLYSWDQVSDTVHKLHGIGPKSCSEKAMKLLFKYDSGAKQFGQIPARHLSATIDGFTISDEFWQEKKPLYSKSVSMGK